jgi:3-phenylpropionate/trans-cinnamate dioxygenase ferredoxin reductase subunit
METGQCTTLVVVGAGHAGSELAVAARQNGWQGHIVLLGNEAALPYQRPPLSKAYLCGKADVKSLHFRPLSGYEGANIELRAAADVVRVDRGAREVMLADGSCLAYGKLAWCAGGRPRPLTCNGIDPADPPRNLLYLRTLRDADALRSAIGPGARVAIVGGGYIGLEIAASARALGAKVTVLEAQCRVLARVAGPSLSYFYERVHRRHGVEIHTDVRVEEVECEAGRAVAVRCECGLRIPADVVVAGIGMLPNIEALRDAGLAEETGIRVDDLARTADPHILAAGDCTLQHHPIYERTVRLESVPNALEQARAAASWLCGKPKPNRSVPWFWSDQYDLKLQMAGLSQGWDECVVRGDMDSHSFSAFYLREGRLLAMDAVNRPAEFMLVKRQLSNAIQVDARLLRNEAVPLKEALAGEAEVAVTGKP